MPFFPFSLLMLSRFRDSFTFYWDSNIDYRHKNKRTRCLVTKEEVEKCWLAFLWEDPQIIFRSRRSHQLFLFWFEETTKFTTCCFFPRLFSDDSSEPFFFNEDENRLTTRRGVPIPSHKKEGWIWFDLVIWRRMLHDSCISVTWFTRTTCAISHLFLSMTTWCVQECFYRPIIVSICWRSSQFRSIVERWSSSILERNLDLYVRWGGGEKRFLKNE